MSEDAAQRHTDHAEVIEEMAANSARNLRMSIQAAEDQAQCAADEARQDRLSLTQDLESKLQVERQKANGAVKAAIVAEDKLKEEQELGTMKHDDREKWFRREIDTLKEDATKKVAENEGVRIGKER